MITVLAVAAPFLAALSELRPSMERMGALGTPPARHRTGTEIARDAGALPTDQERQNLLIDALFEGELPSSSFAWKKVRYTAKDTNGHLHSVVVHVAPDYLSVGTDKDSLIAVLGLPLAAKAGLHFGFLPPTSKLVDEIWKASEFTYLPSPLPSTPGSEMRKPPYWIKARAAIRSQGTPPYNSLVAGHKKDVVVTSKLLASPGRLAIYGWHKADGKPIQGVSLFHGQDYADYSHGVRPIHPMMLVDNRPMSYRNVLNDPTLFPLVSNESTPFDITETLKSSTTWSMI